jgi:hypothetical protein
MKMVQPLYEDQTYCTSGDIDKIKAAKTSIANYVLEYSKRDLAKNWPL